MIADKVLDAIDEIFGDTSVSTEEVLELMEEIEYHVSCNIDALRDDVECAKRGE